MDNKLSGTKLTDKWSKDIEAAISEEMRGEADPIGNNEFIRLSESISSLGERPDDGAIIDALIALATRSENRDSKFWGCLSSLLDSVPLALTTKFAALQELLIAGHPTNLVARALLLRTLIFADSFHFSFEKIPQWNEMWDEAPLYCLDCAVKRNGCWAEQSTVAALLEKGKITGNDIVARLQDWKDSTSTPDRFADVLVTLMKAASKDDRALIGEWIRQTGLKTPDLPTEGVPKPARRHSFFGPTALQDIENSSDRYYRHK